MDHANRYKLAIAFNCGAHKNPVQQKEKLNFKV